METKIEYIKRKACLCGYCKFCIESPGKDFVQVYENGYPVTAGLTEEEAKQAYESLLNRRELFEEKKERKIERFEARAENAEKESQSRHDYSNKLASIIPFGQPILVGHHSEGRHRKDIDRIHNNMRKSVELADKAEHYRDKVESMKNNDSISSDDPDAIVKLMKEIELLEKERETMKTINKYFKKNKTLDGLDVEAKYLENAKSNMRVWNGVYDSPFPSYELTNLGGRIRAKEKRINYLKSLQTVEESEWTYGNITVKVDKEDNRVKIFFPGKPSESVRDKLKSNGFHWSPYNKAWQRMINKWSIDVAKEVAEGVKNEVQ